MGDIISISVYLDRKSGFPNPLTEKEEAIQRGIAAWKGSNRRKMQEADEAKKSPQTHLTSKPRTS